ncbi:hypothetical protein E2C01_057728 [Portunus trituberculatus]|uniref:Uncharacterized protein n=1 Tax=Portunus trituberculatus TaxID=210409 RepID=A0A5B7H3F3_PORTR|nr:hypothetical protein [Portunus trituberculatus]
MATSYIIQSQGDDNAAKSEARKCDQAINFFQSLVKVKNLYHSPHAPTDSPTSSTATCATLSCYKPTAIIKAAIILSKPP